jgi:hypothetical protein
MSFDVLVGIVGAVWLLGLAAGLLGIWFGCVSSRRRFKLGLGFSLGSLAMAFAGLNWIHFSFTRSVNGSSWSLDSRWFYWGSLGLALLALGLTVWKQVSQQPPAGH